MKTFKNDLEELFGDINIEENEELIEALLRDKEKIEVLDSMSKLITSDSIEQIQILLDTVTPLCGYYSEIEFEPSTYQIGEDVANKILKSYNPMQSITYLLLAADYILNTTEFIFTDDSTSKEEEVKEENKDDSIGELATLLASLTPDEIKTLLLNKIQGDK